MHYLLTHPRLLTEGFIVNCFVFYLKETCVNFLGDLFLICNQNIQVSYNDSRPDVFSIKNGVKHVFTVYIESLT